MNLRNILKTLAEYDHQMQGSLRQGSLPLQPQVHWTERASYGQLCRRANPACILKIMLEALLTWELWMISSVAFSSNVAAAKLPAKTVSRTSSSDGAAKLTRLEIGGRGWDEVKTWAVLSNDGLSQKKKWILQPPHYILKLVKSITLQILRKTWNRAVFIHALCKIG